MTGSTSTIACKMLFKKLEILTLSSKYRIFPSITRTPYFSVLTNLLYRYRAPYVYRAPENRWNTWPGPYLGILRPWPQENVPPPPPYLFVFSYV
jgi:hypothetical protein